MEEDNHQKIKTLLELNTIQEVTTYGNELISDLIFTKILSLIRSLDSSSQKYTREQWTEICTSYKNKLKELNSPDIFTVLLTKFTNIAGDPSLDPIQLKRIEFTMSIFNA